MKSIIGIPDMGDNSLRKDKFFFGKVSYLEVWDQFKLKARSDKLKKGLNLNPNKGMGILDVKVLITGIMRSGVNIEQPSGRVIRANAEVDVFAVHGIRTSSFYCTGDDDRHLIVV